MSLQGQSGYDYSGEGVGVGADEALPEATADVATFVIVTFAEVLTV